MLAAFLLAFPALFSIVNPVAGGFIFREATAGRTHAARILLAAIFLRGGINKIIGYSATQGYMRANGVPDGLLPVVIATELGGGLLILFGWQTRIASLLLAGFTLVAAALFHTKWADPNQVIHFTKNLAIAGGFLSLFVAGAGPWSLDRSRR